MLALSLNTFKYDMNIWKLLSHLETELAPRTFPSNNRRKQLFSQQKHLNAFKHLSKIALPESIVQALRDIGIRK
jgi:hypothetical protein